MKIITTDEQVRKIIPHVLATVEGEASLIEKLAPFIETAEVWASHTFVSEDLFDTIAAAGAETAAGTTLGNLHAALQRVVVSQAFMSAIPSLDLVLTPNGFGIVSNTNVVPASKERIERLIASLEKERDNNIEPLLLRLAAREDWRATQQGKYFGATMFPFLALSRRLAIKEHIWDEYQQLHDKLVKIETVLAETYFSHEQMAVLRGHVMNQMKDCPALMEQVIRSLQSLELLLVTNLQCHPQAFYDLVNIMREHEDIFPEWHASETAKLYSPTIFENKKKSGGYWF